MRKPLQYLIIIVKLFPLEKLPFSNTQILRLFVNTLTVDEKHFVLNRGNLTQPIHMQLPQKQKTFSEFFFCIFKIYNKI